MNREGKGKVSFTVMQPLMIHRDLFNELHRSGETMTPELKKIFRVALTAAGGYDKKTIILGVNGSGPESVHSFEHEDLTEDCKVVNPMFVNKGQINMLLGQELDEAEDPIFPHSQEYLIWNHESNLERRLENLGA